MPSTLAPSSRALGWSRAALGAVYLARHSALVSSLPGIHLPPQHLLAGWPEAGKWPLALFGADLPFALVAALCVVRTVAALGFTLGVFPRASGILCVAAGYLVMSQDPSSFLFTQHVMHLGVLALALSDGSSTFALRPSPPWLGDKSAVFVRAFVASIYFWSAVPKLRGPWLDGHVLRAYYALGYGRNALGRWLLDTHAAFSARAVVGLELVVLPVLLLGPRTRLAGVFIACMMHAVFEATVRPDVFGWVMIALLVSMWPEDRVRLSSD